MDSTDQDLFSSYIRGDFQSFESLYERYSPAIYRVILTRVSSPLDAADLLEAVFLKFHSLRRRISGKHQIRHWFFVLTLSELKHHLTGSTEIHFENTQEQRISISHPENRELDFKNQLHSISSSLSEKEEEILTMRFIDELAFEEIAAELGINHERE